MTYLDELLTEEQDVKREVEYISLAADDDTPEPSINDGDMLGVLPLRNMVLFPGVLLPVTVARPKSKKLVTTAFKNDQLLAVCCQRVQDIQEPNSEDLYSIGTAGRVMRTLDMPDGSLMVILEGVERIEIQEIVATKPYMKAKIKILAEDFPKRNDKEFIALVSSLKAQAEKILKRMENIPAEAGMTLKGIDNPPTLVNYICGNFGVRIADKQKLLEMDSLKDRAVALLEILTTELQMLDMRTVIQNKTKEDIDKEQREYYLHRQMETIQKELGDSDEQQANAMLEQSKQKKWSEKMQATFEKELKKLRRMNSHSPEYATQQNYLDTLLDLPWNEYSEDNYDIRNAQEILDKDHYGMEKVKERIIEYLAVLKMKAANNASEMKAPILCLYGPPGVGKTSLGRSISEALGRKYARISLGGLHDESEIRGHRRTYIGAMPGRIIENLRKVKTSNPVFVLDEIDKIGSDYKGDPTSALLEVLDPEQNGTFHDNYLDVDYDLSKVLFIATANSLDTIPRPLLDRMELIEMTGYLQEEKEEIAKRHLLPKELSNHGLKASQLKLKKAILSEIIDNYTRESGVRNLERQIAAICRKVVTRISLEEEYNVSVTSEDLVAYLGKKRYSRDEWETNKYIGVVTGLAWTQVGGEILFIETSLSPTKTPTLTLTGNLGDVMKESASIALGYIKAHADQFGIARKLLDTTSVHIHVPEGAIPKDGPSAGITMTTALVSAFTKRKVRPRVAMTGEMTLRGKVLPIGGVKEKILAAKRAGITDLVLCEDNRKDVEDIAAKYLKGLSFHYVKDIQEVIDFALL
ncbi:MAG: endopeptidase La [Paludibacteraceae bacterium]|jgi:ATP-dependent Lon protease|nr:endopeptidase La [Paludibacteraceae bacterium]